VTTGDSPATASRDEGGTRRRIRVPTSLVLTILGGALTILILPAFTRQWEERERALDLKASLVDEISTGTGRTLASAEVLFETFKGGEVGRRRGRWPESFNRPSRGVRRIWLLPKLKIEGRLRAYFAPELLDQWEDYDYAMLRFLEIAALEGYINRYLQTADDNTVREGDFYIRYWLSEIPMDAEPRAGIRGDLLNREPSQRRFGLFYLERVMLDLEAAFTNSLLAAHPRGFSTTRRDLINDLLP
jgi:hypothetical protein